MKSVSVERIIRDEENIEFQPTSSFLLSYPEFLAYFENLETIGLHDLIIGAYFTYGWMPTMLKLRWQDPKEDLLDAVSILNEVKRGNRIGIKELQYLKRTINNSLVGATKLLHFVNPHHYAMWDSRVYRYINDEKSYYQLNKPENYMAFLEDCEKIVRDSKFKPVHTSINGKIGYKVTPYRAVELVMFKNGGSSS